MHEIIALIILCVLGIVGVVALATVVILNTRRALAIVGKPQLLDGLTGLAWLKVKLIGWKTHILLLIAAGWQFVQFVLQTFDLTSLPFATIFEGKTANYITFGLAALAMLTHADGLRKVASLPPQE